MLKHVKCINKKEEAVMNFSLTKEQEMVRKLFKEFSENEVKPIAAEVDQTEDSRGRP